MKKKAATEKIKGEGVRQGAALQRVIAKRKAGKLKKLKIETVPEFTTEKQVVSYFNKQLESFRKTKVMKFVNRVKALDNIKQIQKEREQLKKIGTKSVMDILESNEDLIDEELFEELDERFETVMNVARKAASEKIEELK